MKHLSRDIFKFLVIFMILFHVYPEYKYWTNKYQEEVNGGEVYQVINASKKKGKKKMQKEYAVSFGPVIPITKY